MIFPDSLPVFGDQTYRGDCPDEQAESIAFFAWLRDAHPVLAAVATHVRNEGRRSASATRLHKLEGMRPGYADIIIATTPAIIIEMKKADHTKSRWQAGQREFLLAARNQGAFACVALGALGAALAVEYYLQHVRTI